MTIGLDTIRLDSLTADPASPADGDVWYNATEGIVKVRENGVTIAVGSEPPDEYEATATGDITTTSTTDVLATGMTVTPPAGTYLAFFRSNAAHDTNNAACFMSLYAAGVQVASSEAEYMRGGGPTAGMTDPFCCIGRVTVNGSQAVEGRWRVTAGTGTLAVARSLHLVAITPLP